MKINVFGINVSFEMQSRVMVNKVTAQVRLSYELCHHSLLYISWTKKWLNSHVT